MTGRRRSAARRFRSVDLELRDHARTLDWDEIS